MRRHFPGIAPWFLAIAATTALAVVLFGSRGEHAGAAPAHAATPAVEPALPARARATTVEAMFRRMRPYAVQPDVGPSGGKAATCSIYSDGNLDNGARVTWAVTLCVVKRVGGLAG